MDMEEEKLMAFEENKEKEKGQKAIYEH